MRKQSLPALLLLLLVFVLAACGNSAVALSNTNKSSNSQPTCRSTVPASGASSSTSGTSAPLHMHMGPHMKMTSARPVTTADMARVEAIVQNAHACFDKYKDYRLALQEGYRIFAPNIVQDVYHFVKIQNFFEAQTTFDLAHPSALLYKKVGSGYQFVGVMYSAPASTSETELNARIPLSVAPWHLHVNICLPAGNDARTVLDQTLFYPGSLFGLSGTITTQAQCDRVGGTFYPELFGWMVHIPLFGSVSTI